jgi:retron-type reverse transcriptase
MKRIGNLYEKIISLENLKNADKIARKGKSKQYGVRKHLETSEENITWLYELLKHRKFETSFYSKFEIYQPKHRIIARLPYYPDRILQHAIILQIGNILTKTFTNDTYSCVKGRGILKASMNLRKSLQDDEYNQYCLKLDIKKFYENINHDILKSLLRKKFKDKNLLNLLDEIIDSNKIGLPLGSLVSQYLANFYLCYLDHFIKQQLNVKYYFRYMDDLVILSNDKKELHHILAEIRRYITGLKLEIKGNYQIFPVEDRGIDFVGFVHRKDYTLLRKSIKKNYIKNKNKINHWSWLKHCNSVNLKRKYEHN